MRDAKIIADNLDKLEGWLESADENGLFTEKSEKTSANPPDNEEFKKDNSQIFKNIVSGIIAARKELDNDVPKIAEAYEKYASASHTLNKKINSSSIGWQFKYSYGGYVILYFVAIFCVFIVSWLFFSSIISDTKILWIPSWAFFWGATGSILQGFWWLWRNVSDRYFRKHALPWYFILPIMGAILGALAYLIFVSGFVAATGETNLDSEFFIMLLSALAGFSSRWAVDMLQKLTQVITIKG